MRVLGLVLTVAAACGTRALPPEEPAIITVRTAPPEVPPPEPPPRRTVVTETSIEMLDPIRFVGNTAELDPRSTRILTAIAETLASNPSLLLIQVRGHSDSTGRPAFRADVAGRRAEAVVEFLVAQGIAPDRLESYGASDSERLYPIDDARNRRVDLLVLERKD